MTVINTNVGALTARTYAVKATANTETAMERLSSGLRINSAADDAAGLAVANKMESQLRGMNMAIRNSQDGISLVQTAEAAMGEINNMAIRMRELAVQMNNGVYTDSDRANAQLEVTALLAEIDKIANNAAFNEVKILDGTYSQDIRAGNTNPEIINVAIDRMNTDSLGGANLAGTNSVATNNQSADVNAKSRTSINLTDANTVTIKANQLGSGLTAFAAANGGGTYSLDATSAAAGYVISSSGEITNSSGVSYSTTNSDLNTKSMTVTYTQGSNVFVDDITLNIQAEGTTSQIKSASSTLNVNESANVSFRSVNTHQAVIATDGALSSNLQSFVAADSYGGSWALAGADASDLSIDTSGVVTASLSFEADGNASNVDAGGSGTTGNQYTFDVVYTSSTGDTFTESVTLNVANQNEERDQMAKAGAITMANFEVGSEYEVTVDGQTITATKSTTTAETVATMADALNAANTALATSARGRFEESGGALHFVYDDAVGNHTGTEVSDVKMRQATQRGATEAAMNTGVTGTNSTAAVDRVNQVTEVSGISGVLNSAANGDQFRITVDSAVITTAAITGVSGSNNFSVADLAAALNTANSATLADVTFGVNNDKLTITTDSTKTSSAHTAATFQWIDDSSSTTTTVGSINTSATAGVDAVKETLVIGGDTGQAAVAANFTGNQFVGITIDGVDYTADLNGTAGPAGIVAALNGNTAFSNLFTASVVNVHDVQIEADTAGTDYAFTATNLRSLNDSTIGAGADLAKAFMGGNAATNTAATQQEGVNTNAFDGAVNASATRTATTTGATTTVLNGNFGSRTSTEVSEAKNTITVAEAAVVKFGTDAMSSAMSNYMTTTGQTGGTFKLDGADKTSFEINANSGLVENKVNMDADGTKTSYTFDVVYTDKNGGTFTDKVTLNLTNSTTDDVQHIADVNMSTQGGASSAIGILDSAINQISASQAKLGAIQNRLEHNIDNLSMASMLTETSKGRIIDADFAAETSELSKQQILAQAATSMLAQANQSKQSVLALLQ